MQSDTIRIGTRGSPLALAQAEETRRRLANALELGADAIEIVPIRTSGDRIRDRPLADIGGKGLFTKEIEEALLADEIDIAVHSAKDMPTFLPDGLALASTLPREDPRDAFVSLVAPSFDALPEGARLGTSSPRRRALALRRRPDLKVVDLRGNVETRLKKLADGVADATLLAMAGLNRLDLGDRATLPLNPDIFLPAIGQGAIALEIREDDHRARTIVESIDDAPSRLCLEAERAFLATIDGSCRTPIAGLAVIVEGRLVFRGMTLKPDGSRSVEAQRSGDPDDAAAIGHEAGEEILERGGRRLMEG